MGRPKIEFTNRVGDLVIYVPDPTIGPNHEIIINPPMIAQYIGKKKPETSADTVKAAYQFVVLLLEQGQELRLDYAQADRRVIFFDQKVLPALVKEPTQEEKKLMEVGRFILEAVSK